MKILQGHSVEPKCQENVVCDCCAEIAGSTPPVEPSAQQFAKRPPEGEKLIKPSSQVECFKTFIRLGSFLRSELLM